jgi:hypothetical protein
MILDLERCILQHSLLAILTLIDQPGEALFNGLVTSLRQEQALTELIKRKRQLILQTPYMVRGRPMIAHVEASGLRLREKGRRFTLEISWAQTYNRAAEIAVERSRREALAKKAARN